LAGAEVYPKRCRESGPPPVLPLALAAVGFARASCPDVEQHIAAAGFAE
jgi:hypothetical protein